MLPVPREVLGKTGLGEKEGGTLLALRVRNESSESNTNRVRQLNTLEREKAHNSFFLLLKKFGEFIYNKLHKVNALAYVSPHEAITTIKMWNT